jgi:hypothetical protein
MPLADSKGPTANHAYAFGHLIGEKISAAFVDARGHIWLVVPSGHAVRFGGFDPGAPVFEIIEPGGVKEAIERRQAELRAKMQELRSLVPGIDL